MLQTANLYQYFRSPEVYGSPFTPYGAIVCPDPDQRLTFQRWNEEQICSWRVGLRAIAMLKRCRDTCAFH